LADDKTYCPGCGAEIGEGDEKCPGCGIEFQTQSGVTLEIKRESKELIMLMKVNDIIEAQMIRMFLEDEGIPSIISEGGMTSYLGASMLLSLNSIKILVPESRARDAIVAMQKYHKWDEKELNRYLSMLDEIE